MSLGQASDTTLGGLLTRLTAAEQAGNASRVHALRAEIFEVGAAMRAQLQRNVSPSTVDYLLMAAMGRDLESARMNDEARKVYDGALAHAERQGQRYWRAFLLLRAAHLAMDENATDEAGRGLSSMLDTSTAGWEAAASRPIPSPAAEPPLADLRAQRLAALGRYWAHVGELGSAARVYRRALEILKQQPDPFLLDDGIRLALGEVLMDRGAARELRALIDEVPRATGAAPFAWLRLEAAAAHTGGRFSAALALCEGLRSRSAPGRESFREATARQLEILVTLNRLSDAVALLPTAGENRLLDLFAGRSAWQGELPPSVVRMLALPAEPDPGAAELRCEVEVGQARPRAFERMAQEWAIRSQSLMIEVHRKARPDLLERLDELLLWSATIDSPLIDAERELLAATVSFYCKGEDVALRAAEAERLFLALDMPHRARDACHLLAMFSSGPAAEEARQREAGLVEMMRDRLSPQDWRMYRLNKWDAIDWQLRERSAIPGATASQATTRALWIDLDRIWSGRTDDALTPMRVSARPQWLPRRTAVAHYMCLPDRILIVVAHRRGCVHHVVQTPRGELWRAVTQLVNLLQTARLRATAEASDHLGRRLGLDVVLSSLPDEIDRLLLVPDDVLFHVPFAALTINGARLLNRLAISLLPDPVWSAGRDADGTGRPRRALAAAVPHSRAPGLDMPELPAAEREARTVTRICPGARSQVAIDATCADVTRDLPRVELAHFACHGRFDDGVVARSGLALADDWIDLANVQALSLDRLRLAMIASCWTANARVLPGSQVVGLPAAFLRSGTHAVISALWEVPADVGVEISEQIYARLAKLGAARALAETQRYLSRPAEDKSLRPVADWASILCHQRAVRPHMLGRLVLRWRAFVRARRTPRGQTSSSLTRR